MRKMLLLVFQQKTRSFTLIIFIFFSLISFAQEKIIVNGNVVGENNVPLAGVSVNIKGSSGGTTADANGKFAIAATKNATLVFSFVGYATKDVPVNNRTNIEVVMETNVSLLDQVIVTGYSTQRKKDITGSIAVVDMKALKSIPTGTASQALQGQASGVNVISSGTPGGGSNIFIRGVSSFGNTQPLVIVDGIQTELNDINTNDIESMQVLKDAGAAAIYGVRGSNGVIIITTKKGKLGSPIITYDAYYGTQRPLPGNPAHILNSEDYARLTKIATPGTTLFANGLPDFIYRGPNGFGTGMAGDPDVDPSKYNFNPSDPASNYIIQKVNKSGTNWFQAIFNPAPIHSHNLSASGGTDKSKYFFSLGYFDQKGTMIGTFLKRYSARINTEYKLKKNIRIGENLHIFYKQNPGFSNQDPENALSMVYQMMPIIPLYDIGGNFGGTFGGPGLGRARSPFAGLKRTYNDRDNTWDIVGNTYAEIDFLRHFTLRSSFGGTIDNGYNMNFDFNQYYNSEGNTGPNGLTEGSHYNSSMMWTNTLNYANTLNKHSFKLIAGTEAIKNYGRSIVGSSENFFSTDFNYLVLGNGTMNVASSSSAYADALFSLFGRMDYSYDDKYLLGFTLRRDGSSKFGPQNRYGTFPSASVGWRVSDEKFMKDISWLNDLKFRGSYGVLGSELNVNQDNAYSLYGGDFSNAYYDIAGTGNSIQQGFYQTRLGNSKTSWERNKTSTIGLDAVIFKKVEVSLEYYKKSINGLLFPQPLPYTAGGASAPIINIGDIQNTGFDFSAGYRTNINKDLNFQLQANVTTYKNLIVDIPDPGYFDVSSGMSFGDQVRNQIGHPVSSFFGYEVLGLFQDDADVLKSPEQEDSAPGRFKYNDINGDNVIDDEDRTFFGNPNPDFTYGLNVFVNFKTLDFSAMFYGSQGNEVINIPRNLTDFFGTFVGAKSNVLLNAWTPENTDTKIPKVEGTNTFSTSGVFNSYYMEDGSYLRLRSLSLGYTLKPSKLQKSGLNKLRIYIQATNLFTITKYTGFDPELSGSSSMFGVDYGNYPNNQRNFLLGLNVSF